MCRKKNLNVKGKTVKKSPNVEKKGAEKRIGKSLNVGTTCRYKRLEKFRMKNEGKMSKKSPKCRKT